MVAAAFKEPQAAEPGVVLEIRDVSHRFELDGQPLPDPLALTLGRSDPLPVGEAGTRAQLQRHFTLLPDGWPVAALKK